MNNFIKGYIVGFMTLAICFVLSLIIVRLIVDVTDIIINDDSVLKCVSKYQDL